MSRAITLIDLQASPSGEPASIADFGDLLVALQGQGPAPNPKFVDFARRLLSDHAGFPWVGHPLAMAETLAGSLWNFELPPADPVRAMRHVVEAAQSAGLAAYDDELGLGFLPDARVVPAERGQEWEDLRDALDDATGTQTRPQVRSKLREAMRSVLEPHGFVLDDELARQEQADVSFSRPIAGGRQTVTVFVAGASPEFRCAIHLTGYLDAVSRIFDRVLQPPFPGRGRTFGFELRDLTSDFEKYRLWLEPDTRFRDTMAFLRDEALPLLVRAGDAAGVDWLMNDAGSPLRDHMRRRCAVGALAVAHVAGHPRFEAVAQELVAAAKTKVDGTPQELQAVLAQVRGTGRMGAENPP